MTNELLHAWSHLSLFLAFFGSLSLSLSLSFFDVLWFFSLLEVPWWGELGGARGESDQM